MTRTSDIASRLARSSTCFIIRRQICGPSLTRFIFICLLDFPNAARDRFPDKPLRAQRCMGPRKKASAAAHNSTIFSPGPSPTLAPDTRKPLFASRGVPQRQGKALEVPWVGQSWCESPWDRQSDTFLAF